MIRATFAGLLLVAALAAAGPRAATAADAVPLARDLGPLAADAEPAGGYVGTMNLTPAKGPAGTKVRVEGRNMPPNQDVDLVWRTMEGRWKVADGEYHGREYKPVGYRIAQVRTDGQGNFQTNFTAPEDFGFQHDVVAQIGPRLLTQSAFDIEMTMEISPASGPAGTPISVEFKGIGWRQLENSWDLVYDNAFTGWVSSVTAHGTARFTIPATGRPGVHVLEAIHGEFTFPYRNPQQNPRPDRPRFVKRFTLTPGEAILPEPAEAQVQTQIRGLPEPGELRATPALAPVGTPIEVKGAGLTPGKRYDLSFGTMTGNRVGGTGFDEARRKIAEAEADAKGGISFRFDMPDDLGGPHRLSLDDGGKIRSGVVTIVPSAKALTVAKGPAGTPFSVHLKGVGWTETANIYAMVYDNNYVGYACGFNSQGDVEIAMYATGDLGWHFIDLYPAIYKGQENRPNNFRIPQLSYEADHPGEDLPRFRFAFEIVEGDLGSATR
jgi:hypothetical protein